MIGKIVQDNKKNGTSTDPDNIVIQKDFHLVKMKAYSDVTVHTTEIPIEVSMIYQETSMHQGNHITKENQEISTNIIRENKVTLTPYQSLNHKRKHLN